MPSLSLLVDNSYQAIQTAETEQLLAVAMRGLTPVKKPVLRQVSGIPGSGKSTFCQMHLPQNYLFISFDKIMLSLSLYQQILREKGSVAAYQACEMYARIIGYELLNRAINNHYNILLEHSGTNLAHLELFKNISQFGYQTAVDFIVCDINLAIARAKERQKTFHRYVPETVIRERSNKLNTYIKDYQKIVANISFFDGMNNFKPLN